MEMSYRCMICGNTITPLAGEMPFCNYCAEDTILVLLTEANKDKLPHPLRPAGAQEIDLNDPSKTCQCRAGTCPCGKFVAHAVVDPCNANDFNTAEAREKELAEQAKLRQEPR
jgi:hypothetical protein